MVIADALTGGMIGGTVAAILLLLVCAAGVLYAVFIHSGEGFKMLPTSALIAAWVLAAVVVVVGWLWASWPLAHDYHYWVVKDVTVERANSRLLSDSDGNISQKIVVQNEADGELYGINDTRAASLQKGDTVRLKCKKAYDFGVPRENHGWDCKWNQRGLGSGGLR